MRRGINSRKLNQLIENMCRILPDTCVMYSGLGQTQVAFTGNDTLYPRGIPCRVTAKFLETDYTDDGTAIYTRRYMLTLPGNVVFPYGRSIFWISSQGELTLSSVVAPMTNQSEQVLIDIDTIQVPYNDEVT